MEIDRQPDHCRRCNYIYLVKNFERISICEILFVIVQRQAKFHKTDEMQSILEVVLNNDTLFSGGDYERIKMFCL